MRFVPPMAALAAGQVHFDGDPHARNRPMGRLIQALRALGATIDDGGREALPFTVHGDGVLPGGKVTIDASASSPVRLRAAARRRRGTSAAWSCTTTASRCRACRTST